jgi:hypothetical protein
MLEEIEFHRLAKLRLEVDAPDDLSVLLARVWDTSDDSICKMQRLIRAIIRLRQIL